jgi:hypothetical protein
MGLTTRRNDEIKGMSMKKEQGDWEYDSIFGDRQPGDIRKEHTIYRRVAGESIGSYNVKRITITRIYYGDEDYQDSVESVIIKTSNR